MSDSDRARAMYDAFGRGDVEAVLAGLHSDLEWHEAEGHPYQPDGTPFRGPQEVLDRLFMRLAEEWEPFTVTPRSFHETGNGTVVVEARYRGRFKETDRELDAQVCHVLGYEDGKLKRFQQYTDTAQFNEVMGVT